MKILINKCVDDLSSDKLECKSPEEIKQWLQYKKFKVLVINTQIDIASFGEFPVAQRELESPSTSLGLGTFSDLRFRFRRNKYAR
jgi:hypothetical protein